MSLTLELQDHATQRKRALTDTSALASVVNELVTSERSYVKRLQILKHDYADPLRNFARNKDTAILPAYEAKTLFGNVDNLLPVNEAFLTDLEKMIAPNGARTVGGVGDVALRHFKELRGFEQYKQYYVKREDAQLIFEREVSKRSSRFASYIDVSFVIMLDNRARNSDWLANSTSSTNLLIQRIGLDCGSFLWNLYSAFPDTPSYFAPCSNIWH
jgi:hypothetical protein